MATWPALWAFGGPVVRTKACQNALNQTPGTPLGAVEHDPGLRPADDDITVLVVSVGEP